MKRKLIHSAGLGCLLLAFVSGIGVLISLPEKSPAADPVGVVAFSAPVLIGQVDIDGPEEIKAGQLTMYTITGVKLEDLTADPPKIELLCVPNPEGVFYGVYDFMGRKPAALLQSNSPGKYTIIVINYEGRETKRKEIRVKGGPGPDPSPNPDPEPDPDPGPDPSTPWAKWTKATAERLINNANRKQEARAMSAAMKAQVSKQAAGGFQASAQFRQAVKTENVRALVNLYNSQSSGRSRALDWEIKFNGALESEIRKQVPDLNKLSQDQWANLYSGIAEGLGLVQ